MLPVAVPLQDCPHGNVLKGSGPGHNQVCFRKKKGNPPDYLLSIIQSAEVAAQPLQVKYMELVAAEDFLSAEALLNNLAHRHRAISAIAIATANPTIAQSQRQDNHPAAKGVLQKQSGKQLETSDEKSDRNVRTEKRQKRKKSD